jgi:hypothetical protein
MPSRLVLFGALFLGLAQAGCGTVQVWERNYLAKPKMAIDPDPEATALEQHVFQYREGATGGYGSVGGGCGCN